MYYKKKSDEKNILFNPLPGVEFQQGIEAFAMPPCPFTKMPSQFHV